MFNSGKHILNAIYLNLTNLKDNGHEIVSRRENDSPPQFVDSSSSCNDPKIKR